MAGSTIYDEQARIWRGPKPKPPLFHPDCSIGRIFFHTIKLNPTAVALQSDTENTTVTYEELLIDSIRIAQHLKNLAPNQDDVIGIVSRQITYATHIFCANWFNGTIIHPINPAHEKAVIQRLYGITRPKIIFCEGKYYEKVLSSCQALHLEAKIYTINDHIEGVCNLLDLMKPTGTERSYVPNDLIHGGDQTVCIVNSSGTSGLPKAVCISNHCLLTMGSLMKDDVSFAFSPLDWISYVACTVSTLMGCAKRIITTTPYTIEYLFELLEKYKITNTTLSKTHLSHLTNMPNVQRSLTNLRSLSCSGSTISVPVYRNLRKLLRPEQILMIAYGCSEFSNIVSLNFNAKKPDAVGQIIPGVKVKIIADDGRKLGVTEIGEILVYNGKTWNGYYKDIAATQEMCDDEMWFHTGDLGYFDQDGDLFLVDRKKDIMKYHNQQYTPQEIEQVIAQLPDVVDVCVFGNTNDLEGDRPAAAVVKQKDSKLTEEEVIQYVGKHFEVEWKRLHGGVFFMNSLPTNTNGKVMRKEAKMQALQQLPNKYNL